MTASGLIVSLILLVICVLWIALPFLRTSKNGESQAAAKQRESLQMLYERTLNNIRDLDEDHSLGKMPSYTYQVEREEWVQRGIQLLSKLDVLMPKVSESSAKTSKVVPADVDAQIEAAIAAARRKS